MLTTQFLKSRTSTRDFKDMELKKADLEKLDKIIDSEIIKLGKDDLAFIVQTDGEKVFKALDVYKRQRKYKMDRISFSNR